MADTNVKISQLNSALSNVAKKTLYTGEDIALDVENLKNISGDIEKFSFVDFMNALSYKQAKVQLKTNLSSLIYEVGDTINGINLIATVTKGSCDITRIDFFREDSNIGTHSTSVATGGNFTAASINPITTNTKYSVEVTTVDGNIVKDSLEIKFFNPYYHGTTLKSLDTLVESDIIGMTKDVSAKGKKDYTFTSYNSYCVIAFPQEYGPLTSILDGNNFQNLNSFNHRELVIKGVPYHVYQTKTVVVCNNFKYTIIN